jgi:hypothetical protein
MHESPTLWGMRRSPREEKALSYARDRRNAYGGNSKAARKCIPRRKRLVNRANRHADQQLLSQATGAVDPDRAERTQQRVEGRERQSWRKMPDMPLGLVLKFKRERAEAE